jgi:hypothetical protein
MAVGASLRLIMTKTRVVFEFLRTRPVLLTCSIRLTGPKSHDFSDFSDRILAFCRVRYRFSATGFTQPASRGVENSRVADRRSR